MKHSWFKVLFLLLLIPIGRSALGEQLPPPPGGPGAGPPGGGQGGLQGAPPPLAGNYVNVMNGNRPCSIVQNGNGGLTAINEYGSSSPLVPQGNGHLVATSWITGCYPSGDVATPQPGQGGIEISWSCNGLWVPAN